ncbi:histidine kinase dimerization/phosphoacceptor domain -containing protein [Pseudomonas sp. HR96]|uniref:sensor histidine kinase n=1 Tax=Pseudomonas sp. HR96 TaxID=1027966 RepID=UPI002A759208|nr:histidine kinase dimerization/phosphoacceptor domain -containing protein [Pseudomonas sp. HR96]WPO98228.1 histidine kinase dimerization/phosphoacceptor domain -containing protein [Pseudomonas sp. HR96]
MQATAQLSDGDPGNRLAALYSYDIVDTPREAAFDDLVLLAAKICGTPISVINLIETHRQWFKAEVGLGIRETPLDLSICRHVLMQPGLTVIPDLREDQRMCHNPLVTADDGLRFYAGCLLQTPDGYGIGTLCVLGREPRTLTDDQQQALRTLANQVMAQMELRKSLKQKTRLLEQQEMLLKEVNHRTKNNLQLIINLIELQIRQIDDATARAALVDTSRRIMSIAAVHDKLYRADQVDAVDTADYLLEVVRGVEATAGSNISFNVSLASIMLPLDKAIPLALMVNELVTNSLKYAYPNQAPGLIQVRLDEEGGLATLTIADEGLGLPQGFEQKQSRSLGMRIITSLARQIGAEVVFVNLRPGVECRVSFAVKSQLLAADAMA